MARSGWTPRATCWSSPPTTAATRRRRAPTTRASTSPLLARFDGHGGRRHDGAVRRRRRVRAALAHRPRRAASRHAVSLTHNFTSARCRADASGGNPLTVPSLVAITRWTMLAAAAAVIAGCGDAASTARRRPRRRPSSRRQAQARDGQAAAQTTPSSSSTLLLERAHALEQGDADRLPGTSTGAQATKDKPRSARAKALPLNDVQLDRRRHRGRRRPRDPARRDALLFDNIDTAYFKISRMTRGQDA